MPPRPKGPRLGAGPAHERLMLANLATSLFQHGRITTTVTKAKRLRPYAERLITKARRGDLHNRRQVHSVIRDKDVVHKLFAEIGPGLAARFGGYTRITKIGPRKGDNAPMAVIELVEGATPETARNGAPAGAQTAPPAETAQPAGEAAAAPAGETTPEASAAEPRSGDRAAGSDEETGRS